MRALAGLIVAAGLAGQQAPPAGTVRGTLLEWDDAGAGILMLRARDNRVYAFRFDADTAVEREGMRARVAAMRKGDVVEVSPDPPGRPRLLRAATIRVLAPREPPPPVRFPRYRPRRPATTLDDLFPRGNLAFAGLVESLTPDGLVLRTREHGETAILLRPDTRYVRDGVQVEPSQLGINVRVYVRAGRNLDDDIEAYSVMWGEILKP